MVYLNYYRLILSTFLCLIFINSNCFDWRQNKNILSMLYNKDSNSLILDTGKSSQTKIKNTKYLPSKQLQKLQNVYFNDNVMTCTRSANLSINDSNIFYNKQNIKKIIYSSNEIQYTKNKSFDLSDLKNQINNFDLTQLKIVKSLNNNDLKQLIKKCIQKTNCSKEIIQFYKSNIIINDRDTSILSNNEDYKQYIINLEDTLELITKNTNKYINILYQNKQSFQDQFSDTTLHQSYIKSVLSMQILQFFGLKLMNKITGHTFNNNYEIIPQPFYENDQSNFEYLKHYNFNKDISGFTNEEAIKSHFDKVLNKTSSQYSFAGELVSKNIKEKNILTIPTDNDSYKKGLFYGIKELYESFFSKVNISSQNNKINDLTNDIFSKLETILADQDNTEDNNSIINIEASKKDAIFKINTLQRKIYNKFQQWQLENPKASQVYKRLLDINHDKIDAKVITFTTKVKKINSYSEIFTAIGEVYTVVPSSSWWYSSSTSGYVSTILTEDNLAAAERKYSEHNLINKMNIQATRYLYSLDNSHKEVTYYQNSGSQYFMSLIALNMMGLYKSQREYIFRYKGGMKNIFYSGLESFYLLTNDIEIDLSSNILSQINQKIDSIINNISNNQEEREKLLKYYIQLGTYKFFLQNSLFPPKNYIKSYINFITNTRTNEKIQNNLEEYINYYQSSEIRNHISSLLSRSEKNFIEIIQNIYDKSISNTKIQVSELRTLLNSTTQLLYSKLGTIENNTVINNKYEFIVLQLYYFSSFIKKINLMITSDKKDTTIDCTLIYKKIKNLANFANDNYASHLASLALSKEFIQSTRDVKSLSHLIQEQNNLNKIFHSINIPNYSLLKEDEKNRLKEIDKLFLQINIQTLLLIGNNLIELVSEATKVNLTTALQYLFPLYDTLYQVSTNFKSNLYTGLVCGYYLYQISNNILNIMNIMNK